MSEAQTARKPMIACVDLDVLPVVDDKMEEIDDLIHDTGVCLCRIDVRFPTDAYKTDSNLRSCAAHTREQSFSILHL